MRTKTLQTALVAFLLLAGTAMAAGASLAEHFKEHYASLPLSLRHHLRFLMEDGSMALRVLESYGWLQRDGEAENSTGKKPDPKKGSDEKAKQQLYAAGASLRGISEALQRPPLPPSGHWLKMAQHLKAAAAQLEGLAGTPESDQVPLYVARARAACYECHRVFGGPLEDKALFGTGEREYKAPISMPKKPALASGRSP